MSVTLSFTRPGQKRQLIDQQDNEDRVLTRAFDKAASGWDDQTFLVAVADGVSSCANGGGVAEWLIHERMARDPILSPGGSALALQMKVYLRHVHEDFQRVFRDTRDMLQSGCTLAGAITCGTQAAVFWSGDSPVHHLRPDGTGFEVETLSRPDSQPGTGALLDCFSGVTPFAVRQRTIKVQSGDLLVAATDGVAFNGNELAHTLKEHTFSQTWLEDICRRSYERSPYSDDIGIAAIRIGDDAPPA